MESDYSDDQNREIMDEIRKWPRGVLTSAVARGVKRDPAVVGRVLYRLEKRGMIKSAKVGARARIYYIPNMN